MPKTKKRKENWWLWFTIGLCSYLLIAPNTTIMRVLVGQIQPIEFTFLRSLLIVIIAVPIILFSIRKFNKRNLVFTLGAGLCMLVATISLTYAVKYSSASYAAVMSLVSPIMLIILSQRLMGDKMSFRAIAGVSLAAAGALIVVAAPFIVTGNTTPHFYPLATTLMLFNSFFFTLGIIFSRKSNEAGMPLSANSGLMSVVILIGSSLAMYAVEGVPTDIVHFSLSTWLGIFYSGVVVVFIARIMNIASYEHTGAAVNGGLNYLGTIVAIIIPLVILGEKLSSTVIIGGVIILAGVYLTEKHRAKHHHHRYMHAH
jgi:drug/metabolite transporter (DMT)-like permease